MFKNYLIIALRNLWKRKQFSGIVLFGLATASAACVLLLLTAFRELSFDRFHENQDKLYRTYWEFFRTRGTEYTANMPAPLLPALKAECDAIAHATRWQSEPATVIREGQPYRTGIRYVDEDFFPMFSFPILKGQQEQPLADLGSIVLSESSAKQVFGQADPVGQTVRLVTNGVPRDYTVTAVIADPPANSSLKYNVLTRFENSMAYQQNKEEWENYFHEVYIQLTDQAQVAAVDRQFRAVINKYCSDEIALLRRDGANPDAAGDVLHLGLQPLKDVHFDSRIDRSAVSKAFPIGLLVIGILILAIASINFVNLTLGTSLTRSKEVGVRKVLGARRGQISMQFWVESLLLVVAALVIGLALAQWSLPAYNANFKTTLRLWHPHLIPALAVVLLLVGFIGSGYPALVLSRFQPVSVLKRDTQLARPGRLRDVLVLLQFTLSVLLIACTLSVYKQIDFLRNKPLGFNKNQVLSIPLSSELDPPVVIDRLRNALGSMPAVKNISAAGSNMGLGRDGSASTSIVGFEQDGKELFTHWQMVDFNYIETLGLQIVDGRSFDRAYPTDTADAVVINERFAHQLGEGSAIGKYIETEPRRKVIGVVKDYHYKDLTQAIEPLSLLIDPHDRLNYVFVEIADANIPQTMQQIEATWKKISPQAAFDASFLDENTDRLYDTETRMGHIFTAAAGLAVLLSCMGLFGMAVLVITQRTKEIGIRKVLGASVAGIIGLLSADFMRLVGIAIVVATPLAWWLMHQWLSHYAYSTALSWWIFAGAGVLALLVAFLSLSVQSIRAALANPVESLRSE